MLKVKTIDINAKEWFDKVNGNSYFAGMITINYGMRTEKTYTMVFQYGYGEHYIDIASQELHKRGIITLEQYKNRSYQPLWRYCRENNIILRTNKQVGCKKRDLKAY